MNSVDAGHQNRSLGDEQLNDGIVDIFILIETNVQWNLSPLPVTKSLFARAVAAALQSNIEEGPQDIGQATDSRFVHLSFVSDGSLTAQRR